jgi:site-specific recombinase XerC
MGAEIRQLGNYTVNDIEKTFSHEEVTQIDIHQQEQATNPPNLIREPVPSFIAYAHRQDIYILTANTSGFDTEILAKIKEDPVIKVLNEERGKGHQPQDLAEAICARRSVVAYLAVKSVVA